MGGPFGNRGNTESREQTIANGEPLLLQCEISSLESFSRSRSLPYHRRGVL